MCSDDGVQLPAQCFNYCPGKKWMIVGLWFLYILIFNFLSLLLWLNLLGYSTFLFWFYILSLTSQYLVLHCYHASWIEVFQNMDLSIFISAVHINLFCSWDISIYFCHDADAYARDCIDKLIGLKFGGCLSSTNKNMHCL